MTTVLAAAASPNEPIRFDISGAFYHGEISGPVTTGVSFERDGTVDLVGDTTASRGTWYKNAPDTTIGDDYEVRYLSAGLVGSWTVSAAAADTWVTMTSDRVWSVTKASGIGASTVIATFEIRRTTGGVTISQQFTVTAEIIV